MLFQDVKLKIKILSILIVWTLSFFWASFFSDAEFSQDRLKVVATTSLIGSIVQEVGEDRIEVVTIVPSGMCPGHFDIRPGDIKVLEEARLLLEHGFAGEFFVEDMLQLVENKNISRVILAVPGNWMIPEIYLQAIDKIVEALCFVQPQEADFFQSEAASYKRQISALSRDIRQQAEESKTAEIKVVCSKMQTEFLTWLGFNVVATYGRPEDINPKALKDIIKKAKAANVRLVVDNLQSGAKAGIPIAQELNCPHLTLTNFPRNFKGKLSYLESLKSNVLTLLQAL